MRRWLHDTGGVARRRARARRRGDRRGGLQQQPGGTGDRLDPLVAAGGVAGGARRWRRSPRVPSLAAGPARAVDDAGLAGVAAHLVLIAVVDHDLQPVGTPGCERDLPAHLGPESLVLEP